MTQPTDHADDAIATDQPIGDATGRTASADDAPLLEMRGLEKHFDPTTSLVDMMTNVLLRERPAPIRAVDNVNITLGRNEVEGIIGESGCGKSTLLLTLMGLYEPTGGEILFDGAPISEFDRGDWKEFRRRVQIIFQDPFNSMDPKFTVRETLEEPLSIHGMGERDRRIHEVLEQVELNPPEKYLDRLPSQLSGGEKQRVSIARALVTEPDVILADEPVSMLDVSTQAAVLRLLDHLTDELGVSMLYISHDLSTVSYICGRVNVMYLGRIIESAPTRRLLDDPKHPYTEALIGAIPIPDPHHERTPTRLEGTPGDPSNLPAGCRFKDRCPERMDVCDVRPAFWDLDGERSVACHLHYDHEAAFGSGERPSAEDRSDGTPASVSEDDPAAAESNGGDGQ